MCDNLPLLPTVLYCYEDWVLNKESSEKGQEKNMTKRIVAGKKTQESNIARTKDEIYDKN